jgi:hypothetical protein
MAVCTRPSCPAGYLDLRERALMSPQGQSVTLSGPNEGLLIPAMQKYG